MFKCDKCKESSKPRTKCTLQVTGYRDKSYVNRTTRLIEGKEIVKEKTSKGQEIISVLRICSTCVRKDLDNLATAVGGRFDKNGDLLVTVKLPPGVKL